MNTRNARKPAWTRARPIAGKTPDPLARIVKARILDLNMSPHALAEKSEVSVVTVYRWFSGLCGMRSTPLSRILRAVGLGLVDEENPSKRFSI